MSDPSPLDAHLGFWLRQVSNHVSQAFALKLKAHGVSVAEWVVLRLLWEGAVPPSRLAADLGMTRGAVTRLIDRLIEHGLVARGAAEGDRRFQAVRLTEAGRTQVPVLAALADQNDAEFFGHLSAEVRGALEAQLRALVHERSLNTLPVD